MPRCGVVTLAALARLLCVGNKLASWYRSANAEACRCHVCKRQLRVRCERTPCEEYPRGKFNVSPCNCRRDARKRNRVPAQFRNLSGSLSQLHQRTRTALDLDALGFVPEQFVAGYRVDDLNRAAKIIVEVNGDYVHANPAKYAATDRIVMEFNRYTAAEKWAADAMRTERLRAAGYRVLVAWESDGLDDLRQCIALLLAIPPPVR